MSAIRDMIIVFFVFNIIFGLVYSLDSETGMYKIYISQPLFFDIIKQDFRVFIKIN